MTRAFAYLRVSGKGQVEGDGFHRQLDAITRYAEANGIEVVCVFREEGVSGTLEHRPVLARLMVDLEQNGHGVKLVIVERLDRLARDLSVQEGIISDFKKHDYQLISAMEGADLLEDDPTRKLVRQIIGSIAEYDKTMTVQKLKAARDRKRELTGRCEGRKPFSETPEGQHVLQVIKRLRRKKPGCRRMTYVEIADTLNAQGFFTSQGKAFTGYSVINILKAS